jgi:WD40 repeat protein
VKSSFAASRASVKLSSAGSNLSIAWSPCGTYVAVGNKSDVVTVFDVRTSAVCKKKKFLYEVRHQRHNPCIVMRPPFMTY